MLTGFWWADLRERNNFEDLGIDGKIILKSTCRKWDVGHGLGGSRGSGQGRVAGCDGCVGFRKMRGISWLATDLLTSQEGFCSVELINIV